ncbi:MAG: glycine cleavage system protein T [Sulfobacillus benefaciens]|uniref:Aminomethyltransferase n=1 Tax=Sulfobacillus benefaciens TaxID=453960 RepID=A0A2T2XBR4_9FIRM|nr:MAG: glycine cleavage system protein T [Sulfobacillus benefaciens]
MKTTPLTAWHRQHKAKMMEFGGYDMPVEYTSIIHEHETVRHAVGMFDVSHMGEFVFKGDGSGQFLEYLVTNLPSQLQVGQALYTPMCYPNGNTIDDLLIYRMLSEQFLMVVNAANREKDWTWITAQAESFPDVEIKDISDDTALIAVQGPLAENTVQSLTTIHLNELGYYHAVFDAPVEGRRAHLSRTGYTGEDGFELYVSADEALALWDKLYELGVQPAGLGARDTLRLESRLPLYGHELDENISPLEAGLGMFVKFDGHEFVGRDALWAQKTAGLKRKIVGLTLDGGIARPGYPVQDEGNHTVGVVTSGSYSPTLKVPIALALVDISQAKTGTRLKVLVRNRAVSATIVKTPFYRRSPS